MKKNAEQRLMQKYREEHEDRLCQRAIKQLLKEKLKNFDDQSEQTEQEGAEG